MDRINSTSSRDLEKEDGVATTEFRRPSVSKERHNVVVEGVV